MRLFQGGGVSASAESECQLIHHGDLFDVLPTLDAESIDACVTDPPYGIGFMGKAWDAPEAAGDWPHEVFRVLKPGAYLLAFGGTRTFHRLACGIEDAGLEIRDCLSWLYGQGFPKSLNLPGGLGTALKPSWEPIILARKPILGTVVQNVEKHGTAALNIDACRLEPMSADDPSRRGLGYGFTKDGDDTETVYGPKVRTEYDDSKGRWPSNVLLDEAAAAMLDDQTGELTSGAVSHRVGDDAGGNWRAAEGRLDPRLRASDYNLPSSVGGASRFYYVAKPSKAEREYGLDDGQVASHPTVKPVELMRWLVRLVTPVNGLVLDPFTGSGTTGMACRYEQRRFIGIEREANFVAIAEARISAVAPLFGDTA